MIKISKRLTDGNVTCRFTSSIGVLTAPTVAELSDSSNVVLETVLLDDGLKIEFDEGTITGNVLASTQDFESPGRTKAKIELTGFRDSSASADRMWTVMTRGTLGYLVVRRAVTYTTAFSAGQKVEVYTVTCGERRPLAPERESYDKFMITMYPSGTYNVDVTVAA